AYFTVADHGFAAVADDWSDRGLAREWTSAMGVLSPGRHDTKDGPTRWAAPGGLRSLVRDMLAGGPEPGLGREVRSLDELDPDAAVSPVVDAVRRLLGLDAAPEWTHAHRWHYAKPAGTHGDAPFELRDRGGRLVGRCGDSWCPSGSPRVEAAWLSGTRLGQA